MKKQEKIQKLLTEEGKNISDNTWNIYPRPLLTRDRWQSLNGYWDMFSGDDKNKKVKVPFPLESQLSEFDGKMFYGAEYIYQKEFSLPAAWLGCRILLHFGAVSNECKVYINDMFVGEHHNGYTPFSFDITDKLFIEGINIIRVSVTNDLSTEYPYGKQKEDRGGMWYTPITGIWQTVWAEPVPAKEYIEDIKIKTDLKGADIYVKGIDSGILYCERQTYEITDGHVRVDIDEPELWTPEDPRLYFFNIQSSYDDVRSYFGLRTISTENIDGTARICLNGKPYFFHGILDQGYYSDGLYTPASPDLYISDIEKMKALGFNTLRKHIKVEPQLYYYECDRLGMIVFQDMVNNGEYDFFKDTVLPTIGINRLNDKKMNPDQTTRDNFISSTKKIVDILSSHPCICYWTIFNEGWGQFDADSVYDIIKEADDTRIVDSTSGWFRQNKSDVFSIHTYFKKLKLNKKTTLPQIISEFGGYVYKDKEHSYNLDKTYGYKMESTREQFVKDLVSLYEEQVIPLIPKGLCGCIYTQLSDVEDETNGILTFDRKVCKVLPEEFSHISEEIKKSI